jgi:hypothetical protein
MRIVINSLSDNAGEKEAFEKVIKQILTNGRNIENLEFDIHDMHLTIEKLKEGRDKQLEQIDTLKLMKKQVEELRREVNSNILSNSEIVAEIMTETLSKLGFNRKFVEGKINEIESFTNFRRRNGFFKSSEQEQVYSKLGEIEKYLNQFPDLENEKLKEFCNLHAKKMFTTSFDEARETLNDFKLSNSALNELSSKKINNSNELKSTPKPKM